MEISDAEYDKQAESLERRLIAATALIDWYVLQAADQRMHFDRHPDSWLKNFVIIARLLKVNGKWLTTTTYIDYRLAEDAAIDEVEFILRGLIENLAEGISPDED